MNDSLVARVASLLERAGIPNALIGAGALAVHGISRSTFDRDLLTTDARTLTRATWAELAADFSINIRLGDDEDPLRGVVRIEGRESPAVDVVVGRSAWQARLLEEAAPLDTPDGSMRVVSAVGLVLLKLYAAGPQDLWDVEQLRSVHAAALDAAVESRLGDLPEEARRLWRRLTANSE